MHLKTWYKFVNFLLVSLLTWRARDFHEKPLRTLRWIHWPNAHRPQVLRLCTLDQFSFICALSAMPSGFFQYWIIFGQTWVGNWDDDLNHHAWANALSISFELKLGDLSSIFRCSHLVVEGCIWNVPQLVYRFHPFVLVDVDPNVGFWGLISDTQCPSKHFAISPSIQLCCLLHQLEYEHECPNFRPRTPSPPCGIVHANVYFLSFVLPLILSLKLDLE